MKVNIFYKAERVGKNGKPFIMWKFRTMKLGNNGYFASEDKYTWAGKFLRKTRLDELPQLWNILKGDMAFVGPRPEEESTMALFPEDIREKLLSVKPGWFGLGGLFFIDEETWLAQSPDPHKDYWEKIKPMKLTLDFFFINNRCFSLKVWIMWQGFKIGIKNIFT